MPIYEYLCSSCAHRFEVKQSIKDDPIKECVRCGKDVTKLISPPAIMFKGSGWYITDYSDKMKPGGSDTSDKPAAPDTEKTKAPASSEGTSASPSTTSTPTPSAPSTTPSSPSSTSTSPSGAGAASSPSSAPSTSKP
ncbi:MAG: CxxCCXXCSSSS domain-containing protein [Nitrospira sp.]|nr:MAG: CxxCCXXCSSSS domain-containing protein [Nitrospira sp.]